MDIIIRILNNAIRLIHTIIWIRYVDYNMEGYTHLEYIHIYEYTTKRKEAVIYLNNID